MSTKQFAYGLITAGAITITVLLVVGGSRDGAPRWVADMSGAVQTQIANLTALWPLGWERPGCADQAAHEVALDAAHSILVEQLWFYRRTPYDIVDLHLVGVTDRGENRQGIRRCRAQLHARHIEANHYRYIADMHYEISDHPTNEKYFLVETLLVDIELSDR